jgi:hypothetical protein
MKVPERGVSHRRPAVLLSTLFILALASRTEAFVYRSGADRDQDG